MSGANHITTTPAITESPESVVAVMSDTRQSGDPDASTPRIDLILWGASEHEQVSWRLGDVHRAAGDANSLNRAIQVALTAESVNGILCWDVTLGDPDTDEVVRAWQRPGDLWHAGLKLGTGGLPTSIDFVDPTWTFNRDPDATIEATSWRLSFRACLMRREVTVRMGPLDERFTSLAACALEFGHRCVTSGVFTRHVPWLAPADVPKQPPLISPDDAFWFIKSRYGAKWLRWSLLRGAMSGDISLATATRLYRKLRKVSGPPQPAAFHTTSEVAAAPVKPARVTVVVPTVDRYPYLRVLLRQLRTQTIAPAEIIVVDQTAADRRDPGLYEEFADLPLQVRYLEQPGQCSSRNLALRESTGDFILFIDDDDEVDDTLIALHLASLAHWRADVSSGVADEVGAGPLPEFFRLIRLSDVFPTNNSMIRRQVLHGSGMFDLAYERGQRADGDLGTRIYLTGAVMVLNPGIRLLHHHAPSGGLRKHKARVQTYAASRQSLWVRHLPSATEFYLGARYFTQRQRREAERMRWMGTFSVRGPLWRKVAKVLIGGLSAPSTARAFRRRRLEADEMLKRFPDIPSLPPCPECVETHA